MVLNLRYVAMVMAMCVPASTAGESGTEQSVRVMRWTFRRDDEVVVCELGLNRDESAYELRINPPRNATEVTAEVFHDAIAAFERHTAIERRLIEEGWSLERFDSGRSGR